MEFADRGKKPDHALLQEVFPVAAGEEKRPRTCLHKASVAQDERVFRFRVTGTEACKKLLIGTSGIVSQYSFPLL